nr:MAG TPA: hypothetical protein [Caudoviricetes sp.]
MPAGEVLRQAFLFGKRFSLSRFWCGRCPPRRL